MNNIDIKLLRTFLTLMRVKNVSRTAEELEISQPNTSHNLNKLRELFDDPLLIRSRNGMIPTPRALELELKVERLLYSYQDIISNPAKFDHTTSSRNFVITAPEHAEQILVPIILRKIRTIAPNIRIEIRAPNPERASELLESGEIDLRIAWLLKPAASLRSLSLFQDRLVYIADKDHPFIKGHLTLKNFLSLPHARTYGEGSRTTNYVIDESIAKIGKALVMTFQVQNFMTVPSSLLDTDIIAALPKSLAISLAERIPLQVLEAPIRLPRINYSAYWHERNQNDAGHKWLRQTVLESAQEIKRSE